MMRRLPAFMTGNSAPVIEALRKKIELFYQPQVRRGLADPGRLKRNQSFGWSLRWPAVAGSRFGIERFRTRTWFRCLARRIHDCAIEGIPPVIIAGVAVNKATQTELNPREEQSISCARAR